MATFEAVVVADAKASVTIVSGGVHDLSRDEPEWVAKRIVA
jgi:hypothetical protein